MPLPGEESKDPLGAREPLEVTLELDGGARYEGGWNGTQKHGQGILTLADGAQYEGQFAHDRKSGTGIYRYPTGSTYSGQWVDDLQSGRGQERWADGSVFEGAFSNGEKHGKGDFQWANSCRLCWAVGAQRHGAARPHVVARWPRLHRRLPRRPEARRGLAGVARRPLLLGAVARWQATRDGHCLHCSGREETKPLAGRQVCGVAGERDHRRAVALLLASASAPSSASTLPVTEL